MYTNLYSNILNPTYLKKRVCEYCGTPIPDQVHGTRSHCPRQVDQNGKIIDCKSKKWTEENKPEKELHRSIISEITGYSERIELMTNRKGFTVNTDDLIAYDIDLTKALTLIIKDDGTIYTEFLNYKIISKPNNTHTILLL